MVKHKNWPFTTAAIHIVGGSTLNFYDQCKDSTWGYEHVDKSVGAVSMAFHDAVHGYSNDIQSGCDGNTLRWHCDQFNWRCNALVKNGQFAPGKHTLI